jgi:DeoR family transcriptional regulator of aga operon
VSRTSLHRADRVSAILETLSANGSVNVAQLSRQFRVSAATLRRDLQMLEEQHLLNRTHGGAVAQDVAYELPVRYRGGQQRSQKQQIARAVVSRIPHEQLVVGLTGGTTTSEVSRLLADRANLTIVTNALNIAAELALRPRLKLVVTGGVARPQSYELVGPWAERTLASVTIGVAVVGVDGITAEDGLTTHDEVEAHTNHVLIGRARRVVVAADGSKVGRALLARMAPIEEVHELVTDRTADVVAVDAIRAAGVTVTFAEDVLPTAGHPTP